MLWVPPDVDKLPGTEDDEIRGAMMILANHLDHPAETGFWAEMPRSMKAAQFEILRLALRSRPPHTHSGWQARLNALRLARSINYSEENFGGR